MLRITTEKKDRYRPLFCTSEFYQKNKNIFQMWKTRFTPFSNVEKVQAWVFSLSCLRRPTDWYGGERRQPFEIQTAPPTQPITLADLVAETPLLIPRKLSPQTSLFSLLQKCQVKPLPESVHRSLFNLFDPSYPLIILNHVPTPYELLTYQLKGQRVISFNEDFDTWPESLNAERDFLSFIIHDLIHADHFFKDNKNKNGQLGFYCFIEKIWLQSSLQELLLSSEFKTGFEYIISDMNSHPVHLFKTLQALLSRSALTPQEVQNHWMDWILLWTDDPNVIGALQKINTQLFSDTDALKLESYCIAKGQKKLLENTSNLI